jgi:hypothetical protein
MEVTPVGIASLAAYVQSPELSLDTLCAPYGNDEPAGIPDFPRQGTARLRAAHFGNDEPAAERLHDRQV